ncbi:alpha/beta hydrolase [Xylophilus sp. GW821-FHT01B05]
MDKTSILAHHGDGFVQANGLRLHYEQWGDGPRTVIALHGTSLHGKVWYWLAEALGPEYRLIGLDQRSHGDSQRVGSGQYGVEHYCDDLAAFIDRLGLERVSLVGSSLGSRVALLYAARHPERVEALALLDLSFEMPTAASEHMVHAHVTRPRSFANFDAAVAFSKTLPQRLRFSDEVHRRTLQGDLRELADGRLEWRYERDAAIETLRCAARDMWAEVRAVRAPAVILRGADSDVLIASTVERLQREFQGVRIIDVPNAGHSIWGDNPGFTARTIVEALEATAPASPPPAAAAPVAGRSRHTATPRLNFHSLEWGTPDAPALICLHGTSMQASAWTALGTALQDRYRVIALDMRGHGGSDKPAEGYRLVDYADDVAAFMDALGLQRASLIGSSLGTQVAIDFAARYPQRVSKLLLSDPSCLIDQAAIDQYVALHRSRPRRFGNAAEALAFSRSLPQRKRFSDAVHQFTLAGDLRATEQGELEWNYALDPILQTFRELTVDQSAEIRAVSAPVLVLRGQESHVLSRANALKLLAQFQQAELIEIGDSGHTIWGDQPEALARHARAFLT